MLEQTRLFAKPGMTPLLCRIPSQFRRPGVCGILWASSPDDVRRWWREVAGQHADDYMLTVRYEAERARRGIDSIDWSRPNSMHPKLGFQVIVPMPKTETVVACADE